MDCKKFMTDSLSGLLEDGEELKHPIYATLLQGTSYYFGYWGFTENHLLGALVNSMGNRITYTTRIPLDIKRIKIKKSLFPLQYIIKIEFNRGKPCKLRVSKKAYKIDCQEENFEAFCKFLKSKAPIAN